MPELPTINEAKGTSSARVEFDVNEKLDGSFHGIHGVFKWWRRAFVERLTMVRTLTLWSLTPMGACHSFPDAPDYEAMDGMTYLDFEVSVSNDDGKDTAYVRVNVVGQNERPFIRQPPDDTMNFRGA